MRIKIFQWTGKSKRALLKRHSTRCVKLVFSDRALDSVKQINIRLVKKPGKKSHMGDVSLAKGQPNVYNIRLRSNLDNVDLISTLAHELMHVAQYADGRLRSKPGVFVWKKDKKDYKYENIEKTFEEYLNWPWEVEARQFENTYLAIILREAFERNPK